MSALHPALRLLARKKLKGLVRKQRRRLRRPSGMVFAVLGLLLLGLWILSLLVGQLIGGQREPLATDEALRLVRFGSLVLVLMTISSAFNHRGL